MFVAIAKVSGDVMMCRWGRCKGSNDRRKKLALTIYRDFLQVFLSDFECMGKINFELSDQ